MRRRRRSQLQRWTSLRSLNVNGVAEHVDADGALVSFPAAFSLLLRLKPATDAALKYLIEIGDGVTRFRAWRRADKAYPYLEVRFGSTSLKTSNDAAGALTDDVWQTVMITRDGSNVCRAYLDNVEAETSGLTDATVFPTTSCRTPANFVGATTLQGRLAQVVIWSGELTAAYRAEITANPWLDPRNHPDCIWALNFGHVSDSAAVGGTIHDWTALGQHATTRNCVAACIVADAP